MKTSWTLLFLLLVDIVTPGDAQGTKNEAFPLIASSDLACEEILASHTIEGSCCSLAGAAPPSRGCELKVVNGKCKVCVGSTWDAWNSRPTAMMDSR
jgi:hypothetical protein